MKKGLVNIAQGTPEQLSKVKMFIAKYQGKGKKLKTHADAIIFSIEQAEKVPALERENKELKNKIEELEKEED